MNGKTATERLTFAAMGTDELAADGTLTDVQWDTQGIIAGSRVVLVQFGTLGTNGIDTLTVHADDTTGFTPGAGNEIADFSDNTLPANADDNTCWLVSVPENAGRFVQIVVTNGAGATADVSVTGIGIPSDGPTTDADRGVADFIRGSA